MMHIIFARRGLLLVILLASAITDVRRHRIPNGWILAGLLAGLALAVMEAEPGRAGLAAGGYLFRIIICVSVLFPLFVLRMAGAGDIKLMAVMAGFLGWESGLKAIAYGCVAGACLALIKLLLQKNLWQRLNYLVAYLRRLFLTKEIVPYYRAERDGYGVVLPFAFCLLAGYVGYLLWGV